MTSSTRSTPSLRLARAIRVLRPLLAGAFGATAALAATATHAASPVENYALAISWEPAFCLTNASKPECQSETPSRQDNKTFSLHGLWPQNESYCGVSSANKKLDENGDWSQLPAVVLNASTEAALQVAQPGTMSYLDRHEWIEHGTCSGLSQRAYFDTIRKARAAVKIPPEYTDLKEPLAVTPGAVEDAFIKANPGLPADAIMIGCSRQRLSEVRLCLSKDLQFHDCPDVAKRSCRRDQLVMPPVRGG